MITPRERAKIGKEIERMCSRLIEFGCDSSVIVTTANCDGSTDLVSCGAGNFYAQIGSTKTWLQNGSNYSLACSIAEELDDGDSK